MEPPFYIIRWSGSFRQEDGIVSNMLCRLGTKKEVERYAEEMAEKNNVIVEAIVGKKKADAIKHQQHHRYYGFTL